jgi:hypothetical protein
MRPRILVALLVVTPALAAAETTLDLDEALQLARKQNRDLGAAAPRVED